MPVLKQKINGVWTPANSLPDALSGAIDPTSSTSALYIGQHYLNTTTKVEWVATTISPTTTWEIVNKNLLCNRNLLDNPWFTVNQRAESEYTEAGYTLDRWIIESPGATVSYTANGITITRGSTSDVFVYSQRIPNTSVPWGKVVTLSLLKSDGTVKSITTTLPSSAESFDSPDISVDGFNADVYVSTGSDMLFFRIYSVVSNVSINIRAVKLELGSISTLANDAVPNYAEELIKCKYYFERYHCDGYGVVGTLTRYDTTFEVPFVYKCSKRIAPSFSVVGTFVALYSSSATNVTFRAAGSVNRNSAILEFNGSTVCSTGYIRANNATGSYIDISADL